MDQLTAECFLTSIHGALYQATLRSLSKDELIELSKTLQLIMPGIPGDASVNKKVKLFCLSVYASGLFHEEVDPDKLKRLSEEAEALRHFTSARTRVTPHSVRSPAPSWHFERGSGVP